MEYQLRHRDTLEPELSLNLNLKNFYIFIVHIKDLAIEENEFNDDNDDDAFDLIRYLIGNY